MPEVRCGGVQLSGDCIDCLHLGLALLAKQAAHVSPCPPCLSPESLGLRLVELVHAALVLPVGKQGLQFGQHMTEDQGKLR